MRGTEASGVPDQALEWLSPPGHQHQNLPLLCHRCRRTHQEALRRDAELVVRRRFVRLPRAAGWSRPWRHVQQPVPRHGGQGRVAGGRYGAARERHRLLQLCVLGRDDTRT